MLSTTILGNFLHKFIPNPPMQTQRYLKCSIKHQFEPRHEIQMSYMRGAVTAIGNLGQIGHAKMRE